MMSKRETTAFYNITILMKILLRGKNNYFIFMFLPLSCDRQKEAGSSSSTQTETSNYAGFDGREFVIGALVADNRYLKHADLGIGANVANLENALGKPDEVNDSTHVYFCKDCPVSDAVRFYSRDNVITKVEFSYGVD